MSSEQPHLVSSPRRPAACTPPARVSPGALIGFLLGRGFARIKAEGGRGVIPRVLYWYTPSQWWLLGTPRVLRLWVAPWEDAGGDLHDETYLYLRIDDGRWALTP